MKIIKGKHIENDNTNVGGYMEADIIEYEKDDHEKMIEHIFTELYYSKPKDSPNALKLFLLSSFKETENFFEFLTKEKTIEEISEILQ